MIKIGSVQFDEAEVRRFARIRGTLEKQAAAPGAVAEGVEKAVKGRLPNKFSDWLLAGLGLSAAGAVMGLGSQGVGLAAGKVGDMVHATTLNKQFKDVLKADPSLKEDEKKARQYFAILHRASPYLASEPLLAASTVKGMMEYGHAPGDRLVGGILDTESKYQDTRHPYLRPKNLDTPKGVFNVDTQNPLGG